MDTTLEKRVLSRLNAQYVFMPSVSGSSICEFLQSKLLLPEAHFVAESGTSKFTSPALKRKADSLLSPSKAQSIPHSMRVSRAFGMRFNALVREMFGQYRDSAPRTADPSDPSSSREPAGGEDSAEETEVTIPIKRVFLPGSMQEAIYMHASWGMDFE